MRVVVRRSDLSRDRADQRPERFQIGDKIEEGDTVVILESMKMEMPVEAEDEGTVKEILCEEGQAVNEGDTLVVLE